LLRAGGGRYQHAEGGNRDHEMAASKHFKALPALRAGVPQPSLIVSSAAIIPEIGGDEKCLDLNGLLMPARGAADATKGLDAI
ncbi:hypothetical protein ABTF86_20070, partial [Acinetobacter baumannii]